MRAQLEEFQSEAGEMEDRLNAAEAHILSSEAEMAQNRTDLTQWSGAYAQLKATHSRLATENKEIQERRRRLEEELSERRSEMDALSARLEALQSAQFLPAEMGGSDAQQTVAAIALARADSEATLRRREAELSEVRSRLSSMRYSVNVLTAAGAELAAQVASQNVIDLEPLATALPAAHRAQQPMALGAPLSADATREELDDLRGVISDWFGAVRSTLPYDAATLRAFGGKPAAARLGGPPVTIDSAGGPEDASDDDGLSSAVRLEGEDDNAIPHAVMLAAIKAVTATRMDRAASRQVELARELADRQRDLDHLTDRIRAWRMMLSVTLAREPELLSLLDEPRETSAGDMLSACATVALTAYQKKQAALLGVADAPASASASAPAPAIGAAASGALPDEPRKVAAESAQSLALRDWRPVRRARK